MRGGIGEGQGEERVRERKRKLCSDRQAGVKYEVQIGKEQVYEVG